MKKLSLLVTSIVTMGLAASMIAPVTASAASPCNYTKHKKVICGYKAGRQLSFYVDGKRMLRLEARFGGPSTPTRSGNFKIEWKDIDHVSGIDGHPMPYAMFFSGGQAIDYSADFSYYGYSHKSKGSINLRDAVSAKYLYKNAPVGTPVIVF